MGVDSPRVTRVSNLLRSRGLAREGDVSLTVGEAAALVSRVVGERGSLAWAATRPPLRLEGGRRHGEPTALELASDPMLTFDHVGFSYPGGTASVEDVSLELRPGELVAVVGQNGAGKTTVTKLMNGLLKPSSGRVTIAGLDTSRARTSQIAQHVSTLFQDPDRQICKETVVEEVAFSLQLLGTSDAEALSRARDCVEHFGLPAEAAPFSLGRGQRQIVALASVVVTNPEVLILDEPTSGLDYRECMTVMEAVEVARSRGCAVAMVCHDMEVVSDFATRVVVMADGRVLADGLPGEVFADEGLLARACVAAPQVTQLARRLSADVSRGYEGVTEVHDIVAVTEGLVG